MPQDSKFEQTISKKKSATAGSIFYVVIRRSSLLSNTLTWLYFATNHRGFRVLAQRLMKGFAARETLSSMFLWLRESAAAERSTHVSYYAGWLKKTTNNQSEQEHAPINLAIITCGQNGVQGGGPSLVEELLQVEKEFVLVSNPEVVVERHAMVLMMQAAEKSGAAVVYCDEDIVSEIGRRSNPLFKPDFSPELLRRWDYVGPVVIVRTAAIKKSQSLSDAKTMQEIILRLANANERIFNLPEVLVSWRKPRQKASLSPTLAADVYREKYGSSMAAALTNPAERARLLANHCVSIIIPTKDRVDLLSQCIDSIRSKRTEVNYEIIIVNNNSSERSTKEYLKQIQSSEDPVKVLKASYPFNWARLNNDAAAHSTGDLLLFLNNDIEAISDDWLDRLAVQALRVDIGAVGARLTYPNGNIQHAGVVVGLGEFADHIYTGFCEKTMGQTVFIPADIGREVLACTGACLLVEKQKFDSLEGFNEDLPICSDVEFCVRAFKAGYRTLYEADSRLVHHESATRKSTPMHPREISLAKQLFEPYLSEGDPYYNKNLSLHVRLPMFGDW
ncbi:MAG: glycosyltransferase family 2 protein [bacterium]